MYSFIHGVVGIGVVTSTYAITKDEKTTYIVGGLVSFFSHYLVDYLKEIGYKDMKTTLKYEVGGFIFSSIMAILSGQWLFYLYGYITGNGMDLIDKKLYLTILFPNKYKTTYYFHKQKKGIQFTEKQTIYANYVVSILLLLNTLFFYLYL